MKSAGCRTTRRNLREGIEIINPAEVIENYVAPMVEMRKGKT